MSYTSDGAALGFDDDYGTDGLTWTANANLAATSTYGGPDQTKPLQTEILELTHQHT